MKVIRPGVQGRSTLLPECSESSLDSPPERNGVDQLGSNKGGLGHRGRPRKKRKHNPSGLTAEIVVVLVHVSVPPRDWHTGYALLK
eukprot:6500518-Pyramimonas_sp.AAC.1